MSVESNAINIEVNRVAIAELTSKSVTIPNMDATMRKNMENAIYPILNGYRARKGASNNDYTQWQADDEVHHIDPNGKTRVLGMVISTPFDPTTDLQNRAKFDAYVDGEGPAL